MNGRGGRGKQLVLQMGRLEINRGSKSFKKESRNTAGFELDWVRRTGMNEERPTWVRNVVVVEWRRKKRCLGQEVLFFQGRFDEAWKC